MSEGSLHQVRKFAVGKSQNSPCLFVVLTSYPFYALPECSAVFGVEEKHSCLDTIGSDGLIP